MSDAPNIPQLVLVDYSWIKHRAFHAYQKLSAIVNGVVVPTGTLYGFAVLMGQLKRHFPGWTYVFAMDCGRGGRELVYEWYKDNRSHDPGTNRHDPVIRQFLSYRGQAVVAEASGFEADDVVSMFSRSPAPQYDIVIFSSDNDMFQLVSDNPERRVRILRSMTPVPPSKALTFLGEKDCEEKFGVAPSQVLLYRSLVGDESDCIPPALPRIRKELARELAKRYSVPDDVMHDAAFINDQHKSLLDPMVLEAWKRNHNVMSFRQCVPVDTAIPGIGEHVILDMAERYNMKTLLKAL